MPQLDLAFFPSQIVWLTIIFAGLYVFLARYALPRIGALMEERAQLTEGRRREAEEASERVADLRKDYDKALEGARTEAMTRARALRTEALEEMQKRNAALAQTMDAEANEAEAQIDAMRKRASGEVERAASDIARAIVLRLTGHEIPTERASEAVEAVARAGAK